MKELEINFMEKEKYPNKIKISFENNMYLIKHYFYAPRSKKEDKWFLQKQFTLQTEMDIFKFLYSYDKEINLDSVINFGLK